MRERNPIVGISIAAAIDVLECTVDRLIHAHRRGIPSSLDRRRLPCNHSLDLTVKRERSAALDVQFNRIGSQDRRNQLLLPLLLLPLQQQGRPRMKQLLQEQQRPVQRQLVS